MREEKGMQGGCFFEVLLNISVLSLVGLPGMLLDGGTALCQRGNVVSWGFISPF